MVRTKLLRVSIPVILSGGNLGLFTGMSVLSMIEVVFWIARLIFGQYRYQRTQLIA